MWWYLGNICNIHHHDDNDMIIFSSCCCHLISIWFLLEIMTTARSNTSSRQKKNKTWLSFLQKQINRFNYKVPVYNRIYLTVTYWTYKSCKKLYSINLPSIICPKTQVKSHANLSNTCGRSVKAILKAFSLS